METKKRKRKQPITWTSLKILIPRGTEVINVRTLLPEKTYMEMEMSAKYVSDFNGQLYKGENKPDPDELHITYKNLRYYVHRKDVTILEEN